MSFVGSVIYFDEFSESILPESCHFALLLCGYFQNFDVVLDPQVSSCEEEVYD